MSPRMIRNSLPVGIVLIVWGVKGTEWTTQNAGTVNGLMTLFGVAVILEVIGRVLGTKPEKE